MAHIINLVVQERLRVVAPVEVSGEALDTDTNHSSMGQFPQVFWSASNCIKAYLGYASSVCVLNARNYRQILLNYIIYINRIIYAHEITNRCNMHPTFRASTTLPFEPEDDFLEAVSSSQSPAIFFNAPSEIDIYGNWKTAKLP